MQGTKLLSILYVFINFIALALIINGNVLIGDLDQSNYSSDWVVWISFFALLISILAIYASYRITLKIPPITDKFRGQSNLSSISIGLYLFLFILYVHNTGAFVAASNIRGRDTLSAIFTILNPDALFFVYFASRINRRWNDPVLIIWIISSLQRGWFSFIFPLIVLKFFELIRSNKIRLNHLLIFIAIVAVYPFFDIIKVYVRLTDNFNLSDMYKNLIDVSNALDINYVNTILIAAEKIIGRLQLVSHIAYIADNLEYFSSLVSSGQIAPFWKEGVYGVAWDRIFGFNHSMEVPQALAISINPMLDSQWNVNPSIIGWLIIYSSYFPAAAIYLFMLAVFFIWIARSISREAVFLDFVYFLLISLLMPAWIAQLIIFINTFLIYLVIRSTYIFLKKSVAR